MTYTFKTSQIFHQIAETKTIIFQYGLNVTEFRDVMSRLQVFLLQGLFLQQLKMSSTTHQRSNLQLADLKINCFKTKFVLHLLVAHRTTLLVC